MVNVEEEADEIPQVIIPPEGQVLKSTKGYPTCVYQYTFIVSLSAYAGGFAIGSMSPTILYIPKSIPLSVVETTLVVSMVLVGALFGTFFSGVLGDHFGRKPMIIVSGIMGIISCFALVISTSSWHLITGRFAVGLSVGSATVTLGLFLAETSPTSIRGSIQGYGHLAGWVGGIMAHFIGIIIIYSVKGTLCWRIIFLTSAVFYIPATILTIWLLPESPRWLVSKSRNEEALDILCTIYGAGREEEAHEEFKIMQTCVTEGSSNGRSIKDFFKPEYKQPLIIAFILQALQQLSGNNMITAYSSIILYDLGLTKEMSILMTGISILPQVLIVWFVVHTLDAIGRRAPLLISIIGTGLSLAILSAVMQIRSHSVSTWLSLVGILLNRIFFSVGLGPLPTVVAAEILPFPIRGRGLAAAIATGEIVKIISVTTFLPLTKAIHPSYLYGSLSLIMFVGFASTLALLTETKGKPLDTSKIEPTSPPSI